MKAIDRIKAVGEKASDAEYKEQRNADSYNALCDLREKFGLMEEDVTERGSEIHFLMTEVSSLHVMVEELAKIIDEDRDPSKHKDRVGDLCSRVENIEYEIHKITGE